MKTPPVHAAKAPRSAQSGAHWRTGKNWVTCGWRLFSRNPWELVPMGLMSMMLVVTLAAIPMLGSLLVGAVAPILLASAYLAIDKIAQLKRPLPVSLRMVAIKQSPKALLRVFADENGLMQIVFLAFYGLTVALVVSMLVLTLAGALGEQRLSSLALPALATVVGTNALALVLYGALAASLIFALPLMFLRNDDLLPALALSMKICARNAAALLPATLIILAPLALGGIAGLFAPAAGYLVHIVLGGFAFPIAACALYCCYRTVLIRL